MNCPKKGTFNWTHPKCYLIALCALCALAIVWLGYRHGVKISAQPRPEDGNPVYISKALFCDRDSVMYYYEQGLLHDDPKGLFVLGVAARLRYDGRLPEEIQAFPVQQGDSFLLLSANYGYTPAIQAIYCLHKHNQWVLPLPDAK